MDYRNHPEASSAAVHSRNTASNTTPIICAVCGSKEYFKACPHESCTESAPASPGWLSPVECSGKNFTLDPYLSSPSLIQPMFPNHSLLQPPPNVFYSHSNMGLEGMPTNGCLPAYSKNTSKSELEAGEAPTYNSEPSLCKCTKKTKTRPGGRPSKSKPDDQLRKERVKILDDVPPLFPFPYPAEPRHYPFQPTSHLWANYCRMVPCTYPPLVFPLNQPMIPFYVPLAPQVHSNEIQKPKPPATPSPAVTQAGSILNDDNSEKQNDDISDFDLEEFTKEFIMNQKNLGGEDDDINIDAITSDLDFLNSGTERHMNQTDSMENLLDESKFDLPSNDRRGSSSKCSRGLTPGTDVHASSSCPKVEESHWSDAEAGKDFDESLHEDSWSNINIVEDHTGTEEHHYKEIEEFKLTDNEKCDCNLLIEPNVEEEKRRTGSASSLHDCETVDTTQDIQKSESRHSSPRHLSQTQSEIDSTLTDLVTETDLTPRQLESEACIQSMNEESGNGHVEGAIDQIKESPDASESHESMTYNEIFTNYKRDSRRMVEDLENELDDSEYEIYDKSSEEQVGNSSIQSTAAFSNEDRNETDEENVIPLIRKESRQNVQQKVEATEATKIWNETETNSPRKSQMEMEESVENQEEKTESKHDRHDNGDKKEQTAEFKKERKGYSYLERLRQSKNQNVSMIGRLRPNYVKPDLLQGVKDRMKTKTEINSRKISFTSEREDKEIAKFSPPVSPRRKEETKKSPRRPEEPKKRWIP